MAVDGTTETVIASPRAAVAAWWPTMGATRIAAALSPIDGFPLPLFTVKLE